MSHQRRVPFLLASTNSHRHASLAQRRMRRRAPPTKRSAADHSTGASKIGAETPARATSRARSAKHSRCPRARAAGARGLATAARLNAAKSWLRIAVSHKPTHWRCDRSLHAKRSPRQRPPAALEGCSRAQLAQLGAARGERGRRWAHASKAAKSARVSTGAALPRQVSVLAKPRQISSPTGETSIVSAHLARAAVIRLDGHRSPDLTSMTVDGAPARPYKFQPPRWLDSNQADARHSRRNPPGVRAGRRRRYGRCCDTDPLAAALRAKARTGAAGATESWAMAAGEGWRVADVVCTCGPNDRPFEERQLRGIHLAGAVGHVRVPQRAWGLAALAGSLMLVNPGQTFECSHAHGEGDRCLSFQYDARPVRAAGPGGRRNGAAAFTAKACRHCGRWPADGARANGHGALRGLEEAAWSLPGRSSSRQPQTPGAAGARGIMARITRAVRQLGLT